MSKKQSAGILFYRLIKSAPEFLLVHPGGPFWKNKDAGAWSIPKGEFEEDEKPLAAAKREVFEELGIDANGNFTELAPVKQKSGKIIYAWAMQKDVDVLQIKSNSFEIEWPPRSGKLQQFPEIDKAQWFSFEEASEKINEAQKNLLIELKHILSR